MNKKYSLVTILVICLPILLPNCATRSKTSKPEITSKSWFTIENRQKETNQDLDNLIVLNEDSVISDKYWWYNFNDSCLNDLIDIALDQNLDLKIVETRINQSRSQVSSARSAILPAVSANANFSQGNTFSPQAAQKSSNNKSLESDFTVGWELDLFGRSRSYLAASKSRLNSQIAIAKALKLTIIAEVAKNYINLRNAQAQLKIATKNLDFIEKKFALTTIKNKYGLISGLDKLQAHFNLEANRANIPLLKDAVEQNIRALELLLGKKTGDLEDQLSVTNQDYNQLIPIMNDKVIINTPAQIIRNRPDVIASEEELSAAISLEDFAIANFYPRISLLALFGYQTNNENLFNPNNSIRSAGAALNVPIFDFGKLRNALKSSRAYKEEALLQYQKSLLISTTEVENNLYAYLSAKQSYQSLALASQDDKKALEIADKLYQKGSNELSEKIDAEIMFNQHQSKLLQNQTELTIKLILLYKSLGGI
jgi:NodT family efflux transporter outer membrane factor (OMF) lipoprotein